jgi:hypothetical protein
MASMRLQPADRRWSVRVVGHAADILRATASTSRYASGLSRPGRCNYNGGSPRSIMGDGGL